MVKNKHNIDITDTQVLAQLRRRKIRLKMELDRVEIAIRAFTDVDERRIEFLEAAPYMEDEIMEVDSDELAVAILMYNPKDSYNNKIKYALSKIEEGSATQICQYILMIDRQVKNINKFHERITYSASRMYKQGQIEAKQVGRINVYKLKTLPI